MILNLTYNLRLKEQNLIKVEFQLMTPHHKKCKQMIPSLRVTMTNHYSPVFLILDQPVDRRLSSVTPFIHNNT